MKLNSKLWMLAVALATVGCQDDLGNDPNGGTQGNGLEGEKAKIAVAVNTGITTRATYDNPTPGEDGDGDEAGTIEESRVNDVTIFLYDNDEAGSTTPSTDFEFKSSSNIIAAGFATTDGQMDAGTPEHSFYKEVEVTITDPEVSWIGKKVGVIAVTNLGQENSDKLIDYVNKKGEKDEAKGSRLADYLQDKYKTEKGFVMSTHTIGGGNSGLEESTVTLKATQGSEPAPEVNVYVERLAAKIRINEYNGNNFVYTITHENMLVDNEPVSVKDVVLLNDVAIVNQLNSGSYLIKRVTDKVSGDDLIMNATDATDAANDDYLYPELGSATEAATNFVIDPWTRYKEEIINNNQVDIFNGSGAQLTYENRFHQPSPINNYTQLWNTFKAPSNLHSGSDFSAEGSQQKDLCYTMENTTSIAASQNGYSTGAVFKATYLPGAWGVAIDDDTEIDPTKAEAKGYGLEKSSCITEGQNGAADTYTPTDFYLYQGSVFKDRAAIFAYVLSKTVPNQLGQGESLSDYYRWCNFSNPNVLDETFNIADFKASHAATASDPFGYIDYLNRQKEGTPGNVILSFKGFIGTAEANGNPNNVILNPESVTFYQNGVSFYPYWIRHANNDNPNVMGIMEFGIVRNNIYDLTVQGINGYGYVTPVPSTPDENPDLRINVVLYVKDWTLRKNDNIYL